MQSTTKNTYTSHFQAMQQHAPKHLCLARVMSCRNKIKAKVTKMVNAVAKHQLGAQATDTPKLSAAQ